jgi:hypothetical protein
MVKWLPTTDRALDLILSTAGRKNKSGRTKYLNKHFSKKGIQNASKYKQKDSTSLIIRNANQNPKQLPPHTC